MSYNSKRTGAEVEALLDKAGTALQSIPSEYVTETELSAKSYATTADLASELSGKVDKVSGKQLSTEDFTTALMNKLIGLSNYDDTVINSAILSLQNQINTLTSGNASVAIESFNEIIAFLDGISDSQDLDSIISSIEQQIAAKYTKPSTGIPKSDLASAVQSSLNKADTALQSEQYKGTYSKPSTGIPKSDLDSSVQSSLNKADSALQSYTEKYTGTYSKPSTGIPKSDLASAVQTSLGKADTALQSFTESDPVFSASAAAGIKSSDITNWNNKTSNTGTVIGVKMNGTTKSPSSGIVDLGTVITAHQDISGKVDKVSGKQLSTNDYTTTEKNKLAGIASGAEVNVQSDWSVTDSSSDAFIKNKPSIPSAVTESTVSGWGFTKNTGTYSKPSTGIPKTDLASAVQTSLGKADTALQSYTEKYTGTITGITMNGASKGTSGVVNLGTVITAHQDISGKQDRLISGTNIKTINGQSILGSGNIEINGGADFELLTVTVSGVSTGFTIYIKNSSGDVFGSQTATSETHRIPAGTEYHVVPNNVDGYIAPSIVSYTAVAGATRAVVLAYEFHGGLTNPANGVYIQDVDGFFFTSDEWSGAYEANSVAVITDNCRFGIALEDAYAYAATFGATGTSIGTIVETRDLSVAITDYAGEKNTTIFIQACGDLEDIYGISGVPAAKICRSFVFPNGSVGYMGAAGEWQAVCDNVSAIATALSKCGGTEMLGGSYWTSTQYDSTNNWAMTLSAETLGFRSRKGTGYVRAFSAI